MKFRWIWIVACLAATTGVANAIDEKTSADQRIVLQISDMEPQKQALVLNVANQLIKHYGPDRVDIEVVALGPGLRLLFADNVNKDRVQGLHSNGVRFVACGATLKNFASQLGYEPVLNPLSKTVPTGVVEIAEMMGKGYKVINP